MGWDVRNCIRALLDNETRIYLISVSKIDAIEWKAGSYKVHDWGRVYHYLIMKFVIPNSVSGYPVNFDDCYSLWHKETRTYIIKHLSAQHTIIRNCADPLGRKRSRDVEPSDMEIAIKESEYWARVALLFNKDPKQAYAKLDRYEFWHDNYPSKRRNRNAQPTYYSPVCGYQLCLDKSSRK